MILRRPKSMVRPMDKRIEPDLFARLMKMPSQTRNDLFEYLGQTPVPAEDAARLIHKAANKSDKPGGDTRDRG